VAFKDNVNYDHHAGQTKQMTYIDNIMIVVFHEFL